MHAIPAALYAASQDVFFYEGILMNINTSLS